MDSSPERFDGLSDLSIFLKRQLFHANTRQRWSRIYDVSPVVDDFSSLDNVGWAPGDW